MERPELARQAASLGVPQAEDITYYASAEILENSVVPVPANPHALISAASLLRGKQRGMIEGLLQLSAGARHSSADQAAIQRAHDAVVEAGAQCTMPPEPGDAEPADGITGGWADHVRSSVDGRQVASTTTDLVAALDAVIDQALQALQQGDSAAALARLQEADVTVDNLMKALGIHDPDEDDASLSGLSADAQDSVPAEVRHVAKQDGGDAQEDASVPDLDPAELEELDRQLAELTR